MGKTHRGRPLREEVPNGNRGTCPVTKRSGVKLLYEAEIDGKKVMVSKIGKSTLANAKKRAEWKEKKKSAPPEPAATPEPAAAEAPEESAAKEETAGSAADTTAADDTATEEAATEEATADA